MFDLNPLIHLVRLIRWLVMWRRYKTLNLVSSIQAVISGVTWRSQCVLSMIIQTIIQSWVQRLSYMDMSFDHCTCCVSLCVEYGYASLNSKDIMMKMYCNKWGSSVVLDPDLTQVKSLHSSFIIYDFEIEGGICFGPFCHIRSMEILMGSINILYALVITLKKIPKHVSFTPQSYFPKLHHLSQFKD